ncbi:unnamed protein product [Lymnaea stagnalis]|uniref:Uncharacterized protein n=1 Tax=Lymnaea stagnalis TaxID=6523 RepID=A0AAV2H6M5_LYMST
MELLGETRKSTYITIQADKDSKHLRPTRDGAEDFLCPRNDIGQFNVPWRQATYGIRELPNTTNNPQASWGIIHQTPNTAQAAPQESDRPPCYSQRQQGNNIFYPYSRTQLVGGKLTNLPDTTNRRLPPLLDTCDYRYQQPSTNSAAQATNTTNTTTSTGLCRDPNLPMTPALGRSAQLEAVARSYGDGNKLDPNCLSAMCNPPPLVSHVSIEEQTEKENETFRKNKYNSPMSHFATDERLLKNSMRTYLQDITFQKERGQFTDPKRFLDEGDKEWSYLMQLNGQTAQPADVRAESALVKSNCVRVPDGLGGYCYICPKVRVERQEISSTDPICNTYTPSTRTMAISGQKVIDNEINATIRQIQEVSNDREALYEKLMNTEKPLHEIKEKLYSQPYNERRQSTDLINELTALEKSQTNLVQGIRTRGRELSHLLKHQYALECKQANQILEDAKLKTREDPSNHNLEDTQSRNH